MEDYKQKYEQALENIKKIKVANKSNKELVDFIEYKYPELKESEDEKVRKWLIDWANTVHWSEQFSVTKEQVLAWLEKQGEHKCDCKYVGCHVNDVKRWCHKKQAEILYEKCNIKCSEYLKQGEQKPTDYELTPKALFKKGDWVTNGIDFTFQVISIEDNHYLRSDDYFIDIETADKKFRLWTIQDAKDGDILAFDDKTIVIFKDLYKSTTFHSYCHIEKGVFNVSQDGMPDWWSWWGGKGFHPATKEQRDTLMKAMANTGYTFDFEKKELKKIKQNSTWSEEDEARYYGVLETEQYMLDVVNGIKKLDVGNEQIREECTKELTWLKSLKERYTWKPSDEQMKVLNEVINYAAGHQSMHWNDYVYNILKQFKSQLKKMKGE